MFISNTLLCHQESSVFIDCSAQWVSTVSRRYLSISYLLHEAVSLSDHVPSNNKTVSDRISYRMWTEWSQCPDIWRNWRKESRPNWITVLTCGGTEGKNHDLIESLSWHLEELKESTKTYLWWSVSRPKLWSRGKCLTQARIVMDSTMSVGKK